MSEALTLTLTGRDRVVDGPGSPASLAAVLVALELRADRVAVELNGELAPRTTWAETLVHSGDRLEIVHFVGGGTELFASGASALQIEKADAPVLITASGHVRTV